MMTTGEKLVQIIMLHGEVVYVRPQDIARIIPGSFCTTVVIRDGARAWEIRTKARQDEIEQRIIMAGGSIF